MWSSRAQTDSDAARARSSPVDSQHRRAVAHAAAKLSELQNRASSVSVLVPQRSFASSSHGCCQRTSRQRVLDEEERWGLSRYLAASPHSIWNHASIGVLGASVRRISATRVAKFFLNASIASILCL